MSMQSDCQAPANASREQRWGVDRGADDKCIVTREIDPDTGIVRLQVSITAPNKITASIMLQAAVETFRRERAAEVGLSQSH